MPLEIRKREGENIGSVLFRFNKKVKQSGILKESKKRRFKTRPKNKRNTRLSAIYKTEKAKELERQKKYGNA